MAITLNGTTGITTPALDTSGDVTFADNDKAIFGAGSDLQIYHDGSNSYIDDAGNGDMLIRGSARILLRKAGTTENMIRAEADSYVKLYFDNAEKLATTATGISVTGDIISTGDVLVGKASGSTDSYLQIAGSGSKTSLRLENNYASGSVCLINNQGNSTFNAFIFENGGSAKGSIVVTTSATSYNTSSDYRLKTDAQPMTGASARVQALKPVNFEWISSGERVDGFLAHEAQEIVPEAVTGTKDAMRDEEYEVTAAVLDADGMVVTEAVMGTRSVPDYQGIDQSKLVPLLTAALQEALNKIASMETRLAALEAV
jgi:hypothetical protein